MKKNIYLFFLLPLVAVAQNNRFWSNNGALVSIKDKAYLSVNGDMYNLRQGIYDNTDSIFLTGDWINNAGNHAFSGIDSGYVFFHAADQYIKGADETYFHNLVLKNQGVKYALIDAKVDGFLDMTDREFNVDTNTIWVRNPAVNSVRRTAGFLSSMEDGGLLRYTNASSVYLFPVGSDFGISRYRPVEITPTSANNNQFKVRFANFDPTTEGLDRDDRFHLVCEVNPDWYHRLYHPQGSDSAEIAIFYDPNADGAQWNDIAHWQVVPEWQAIFRDTILNGTPFNRISKTNWRDFSYSPFALAVVSLHFADAGNDTLMWRLDTIQLQASGGFSYEWSPPYNISCTDCYDPYINPETDTTYYLVVSNGDGCFDYDSIRVFVQDKPYDSLFIPNVITPNGDGINDEWHLRDLERYPDNSVLIINRWGDQILSEKPYQQRWRGTWKGQDLPAGTYYYVIYITNATGRQKRFDGPITVVR